MLKQRLSKATHENGLVIRNFELGGTRRFLEFTGPKFKRGCTQIHRTNVTPSSPNVPFSIIMLILTQNFTLVVVVVEVVVVVAAAAAAICFRILYGEFVSF
jgi:hypothetical protein